jgi:DNA mismatch repair protein MutS2
MLTTTVIYTMNLQKLEKMYGISYLCFVALMFLSASSAFIIPASKNICHSRTTTRLHSAVNEDTESTVSLFEKDSRAGKNGYSLMRQPLHQSSWDPSVDPNFEAPATLDADQQKLNNEWWSNKKQQKSIKKTVSSSTSTETPQNFDLKEESLDLFQRSLETIDFPYVLNALRNECFTTPGKKRVQSALQPQPATDSKSRKSAMTLATRPLIAETPDGVRERFQGVQEMQWLLDEFMDLGDAYYKNRRGYQVTLGNGNPPPLDGLSFDLDYILEIVQQGNILEGPELLDVWNMINAIEDLQLWGKGLSRIEEKEFVALPSLLEEIQLNATLQTLLEDAFDEKGNLSGETFPVIGRLRAKVRSLKSDILSMLDALVSMPSIKSKLELESGGPLYSEISNGGGRLVIPMNPKYASQYGIVHDSSRSGKTVYVEPSEVVSPTNELRQKEGELRAEEARVWRSLTEQVWTNRQDLEEAVAAVGQLDLVLARCLLGKKLQGVIPTVKDDGVISLQNARHPVLLLREIENVVGSDLDLGADGNQGLVLTGPNSGGKTVILKLLGLVALMARGGIPIPANAGKNGYEPRVDFFNPVLADIGDIQSVGGDLSTFSGHMLVCREVLANSGKNCLVLMDELGSGTDPAQGVAIAQAVLEALLETGCRVAITTHYMALKQLAASDDRFSVAGMQFVRGRPTYKLLPGTVGESFAISVAERLELPYAVINRANELLDPETRQMGDLIRVLEDQKALIDEKVEELEEKKREMAAMEQTMKEEQNKLEKKMLTARRDEAKKFAKKLEEKEAILEDVLEKLKSDPSRKVLTKSWDDIKFVKRDAISEAENVPSVLKANKKAAEAMEDAQAELVPIAEMRDRPDLQQGDKLIVCKVGPLFQREAIVEKVLGRRVQVKVSGVTMAMKLTDLAMLPSSSFKASKAKKRTQGSKLSKAAEKALKTEVNNKPSSSLADSSQSKESVSFRTDSNTVDVLGCNFEEAKDRVRTKISQAIMNGHSVIYVLHGHGTGGVLKTKVRGWLKSEKQLVKRWNPAEQSDGGDAFTRLELR